MKRHTLWRSVNCAKLLPRDLIIDNDRMLKLKYALRMSPIHEALAALQNNNVTYVLVGGLAVVLHGHPRLTADADIVLDLSEGNTTRAIESLLSVGYVSRLPVPAREFADAKKRETWITEKGMKVFSLFYKANPIYGVDLFAEYPVDFEGMLSRSVVKSLGQLSVRVAAIDDIIVMKEKAGRPLDLDDVKALKVIRDG